MELSGFIAIVLVLIALFAIYKLCADDTKEVIQKDGWDCKMYDLQYKEITAQPEDKVSCNDCIWRDPIECKICTKQRKAGDFYE